MDSHINYPAARSKKIIHAAPQFRPIKRGARKKGIERIYTAKNGDTLTIAIFHELDIADQDLLLCLLAIARAEDRGVYINENPESEVGIKLREELNLGGSAETAVALMVRATGYEILNELGRPTNSNSYNWLRSSLKRLSRVSFDYDCKKGFWSFNLLSVSGLYGEKGEIRDISICINPLSAQAILGNEEGYVLVNRTERSKLDKSKTSSESKALHYVLSGLVDMGQERVLNVDMLADKVYSRYDENITAGAIRIRRMKLVSACAEINKLGYWSCLPSKKGKNTVLTVKRKRRKV
ncbi:hypothetical protein BJAS_P4262 [Bathymodiolus japonicus methanotrophic gill symbiont]|uniref:replication protein C, IncQ-type n=1 Tax=Bathymodiolus japonicus methanotrophic gill symbiont TaxID=113269 RepID=UPI001B41E9E1|nr:replication protein C, IncQ-type [Bathymodiolus japonicus methanotrophic gill symbiont]GFO73450.1 hypothetical protein BJAS_P4262 [Bathymodiolus japonicus methanotrophic gill symbiont]